MVYVDYEYYKDKYFGTLPEDSFNQLALKASREIDNNVNTRLTKTVINNLPEEAQEQLKYTACALIDLANKKEKAEARKASSIEIDGVKKTLKTISVEEISKEKKEIIKCLPDELTRFL